MVDLPGRGAGCMVLPFPGQPDITSGGGFAGGHAGCPVWTLFLSSLLFLLLESSLFITHAADL